MEFEIDFAVVYVKYFLNFLMSSGVYILLGTFLKSILTTIYNLFASKKIAGDIQRNYRIKQIVQRSENSRTTLGANRVLVTQIHNGDHWYSSKRHIYKLSLVQDLSLENPFDQFRTKIFDKQLNSVLLSHMSPLLENVLNKKSYDIIPVSELKGKFLFYRHLKLDKVNYLVVVKIQYSNELLGYIFLLFCDQNIPSYKKEDFQNLTILGEEIGGILK